MADYTASGDPNIINKETSQGTTINLAEYITIYQGLKADYQAVKKLKDIPDQDTLDFWNAEVTINGQLAIETIKGQATLLYRDLKPIKDAGLLPAIYDDEFNTLETFISS